jgi:hypothetical protein
MYEENSQKLPVIGPSALVSIGKRVDIPAKIDTGAEASSIWASHIRINKDGVLKFRLFGEGSPFYNGKVFKRTDYKVATIRSAMGEEQIRYCVYFPVKIGGRKIRVLFSLANRSKNSFPILIGKRTLQGKFLVDVSLPNIRYETKPKKKIDLQTFKKDPHKFDKKYVKNQSNKKGEIK